MTAMPLTMAEQGMKQTGDYIGGLTPQQQARMNQNLAQLREALAKRDAAAANPARRRRSAPRISIIAGTA